MSIDTHSSTVAGFRCEAATANAAALPCDHSRFANPFPQSAADSDSSNTDDPAILIGLALAFARQGPLRDGRVPEPLMLRLRAIADSGDAACRLLLDWLQNRNRDLDRFSVSAVVAADRHLPRRSPRKRVLAKIPIAGAIDGRWRGRLRTRDPVRGSETAIIAAETGGSIDG